MQCSTGAERTLEGVGSTPVARKKSEGKRLGRPKGKLSSSIALGLETY